MYIILAAWAIHDGPNGPVPDAVLVLLREREVVPYEELSRPSALAAQAGCSNLQGCQRNTVTVHLDLLPLCTPRAVSPTSPPSTSSDPRHAPFHVPTYPPDVPDSSSHSHK